MDPKPKCVWLVTGPRTASNLLVKMLNLPEQDCQTGSSFGGYFFIPSHFARSPMAGKALKEWTEEEMTKWYTQSKADFDNFQDNLEKAEKEGKMFVTKEHAILTTTPYYEVEHTLGHDAVEGFEPVMLQARMLGGEKGTRSKNNLTVMPDEFLKTMTPAFLIRHPAMQVPSLYRGMAQMPHLNRPNNQPHATEMTCKWWRALHDFYSEQNGEAPLLVDADDIMAHPEIVKVLAGRVGLDPEKVVFSWGKMPDEKFTSLSHGEQVMHSTIHKSEGIDLVKVAGEIDIEQEAVKWREEFGEEGGRLVEKWVRDSMPDYEYLRSKRLTLD